MDSKAAITTFLGSRGLDNPTCSALVEKYYNDSSNNPPRKLFDLYNAIAMTHIIKGGQIKVQNRTFYLVHRYGYCLLSYRKNVSAAFQEYVEHLDSKFQGAIETIKNSVKDEKESILSQIDADNFSAFKVRSMRFAVTTNGNSFSFESQCPWHALERLSDLLLDLHSTTL